MEQPQSLNGSECGEHQSDTIQSWERKKGHDNKGLFTKDSQNTNKMDPFEKDTAFLLRVGSFLLTVELFCLHSFWGVFCLQIELFDLQVNTVGVFVTYH